MLAKLYANKKLTANILAGLLLTAMFMIAFFSSKGGFGIPGDSGTVDEIAHIPSGYTYIKDLDFRLNPEHPPLAKALAGIPIVIKHFVGPEADWSWSQINQWEAGWYMLYETSNNPAQVLLWARLPIMLLMIALGTFLYKWAAELFGRKVGLATLALYAFYPDVIAHGRLVTTDIAAALAYVVTLYYFERSLQLPSRRNSIIAGIAFGIGQLLKFSSFLLFGVLLLLVIYKAIIERKEGLKQKLWQYFSIYFWVCLISLAVVWVAYLPFVWRTPIDIEHEVIERNLTQDPRTLPLRNFLHFFEGNPITRALGHYLLGVFLVVARVAGGNATFLMGQVAEKSIPYFFPVAWLLKTPVPIIVLTSWSVVLVCMRRHKERSEAWILSVILMPLIVYWAFTLKGSLNIGIRHLMPTVPFVLLLIAWALSKIGQRRWHWGVLGILIVFEIAHTLSYYPSYIAYFNNFVPKEKRYQYMIDSSLDWGQDMLRLKKYTEDNNIKDIKIDYFGGSVARYYIPTSSEWHSSYGPTTGWIAISATYLQSSKLYGPKEGKWSYEWIEQFEPKAIVGGSILVYRITPEDLVAHPPASPYPITKFDEPGSIDIETKKVGL